MYRHVRAMYVPVHGMTVHGRGIYDSMQQYLPSFVHNTVSIKKINKIPLNRTKRSQLGYDIGLANADLVISFRGI